MANVLLGVTGSVAAIKTPLVYAALKAAGHDVKVVATSSALYFFDPAEIDPHDPAHAVRNAEVVVLDEDEWPGRQSGQRYQRGDAVRHIELRRWADVLLVAPLDANTLAKFANGLADNCLTCVWRARDTTRPAVLAPAMNTLMWQQPVTARHLASVATDFGLSDLRTSHDADAISVAINARHGLLRVVAPESKELACGDVGTGAMAAPERLVAAISDVMRNR
jgi:phosphopantothenoylcysteine decarboxylase